MGGTVKACGDCRFYANVKPYLIDGKPYGAWTEGDCLAPGTLHPVTCNWSGCHLWKRRPGSKAVAAAAGVSMDTIATTNQTAEPMSPAKLAEIRERAEKAEAGPWEATPGGDLAARVKSPAHGPGFLITTIYHIDNICRTTDEDRRRCQEIEDNTAAFIAHARADVPALVAEVERLQCVLKRISDEADIAIDALDEEGADTKALASIGYMAVLALGEVKP